MKSPQQRLDDALFWLTLAVGALSVIVALDVAMTVYRVAQYLWRK